MAKYSAFEVDKMLGRASNHSSILRGRLRKIDQRTTSGKVRAKRIFSRLASLRRLWENLLELKFRLQEEEAEIALENAALGALGLILPDSFSG